MMKSHVIIVFFLLVFAGALDAQDAEGAREADGLPRQYRGLSLGMELAGLKDALAADASFAFHGDRDVSFLPSGSLGGQSGQSLVETAGLDFIKRAFFQLKDGQVFIMAFTMNTGLIDHYSVYTTFVQKYGEPSRLNPKEAVWDDGATRVSIERPLTVKYIDRQVFDAVVDAGKAEAANMVYLKDLFLREF
jgi:hypothetical protein